MDESTDPTLHERIDALEAQVAALQQQIERLSRPAQEGPAASAGGPSASAQARQKTAEPRPRPPKKEREAQTNRIKAVLRSEDWLNKLGIALLLFGLAFLFKLGIDMGLLTPLVRISFGLALGVFLLFAGLRLRPKRLRLGQVLLGGGIATFYVTLFAAYQFYGLVSYPVAFGGMALATFLGFILAVQQNDAVLAVIATLGGLGTPFLLYSNQGNIPGLVIYTCIILASAGGLYLYRGWRSLLWTSVVGGWLVMMVPWLDWIFSSRGDFFEHAVFQAGLGFCWLAFGVVPVVREIWRHRDPERWTPPDLRVFKNIDWIKYPATVLVVAAPLITLGLSRDLWGWPQHVWGILEVVTAGLYAGAYVHLRRGEMPRLAAAHGVAAALLLAISWFELFDDPWLQLIMLAAEAAALHLLARFLSDHVLRLLGHVGMIIVGGWLAQSLVDLEGGVPVLINGRALVDLIVIGFLFSVVWTLEKKETRVVYALVAYVGLLGWFWRDLVVLANGQAYVSIAWGLSAITLLALGWRRDVDGIRNAGLVTLLVVVAKLFIVDLAKLEAVWRILLFLGFGGLLLLLSYFFPKLWKPEAEANAGEPQQEDAASPEAPA